MNKTRKPGKGRWLSAAVILMTLAVLILAFARVLPEDEPSPGTTEEPKETAEPTQTKTEETMQTKAEEILAGMSLREKLYQLFIVTPEQLYNTDEKVTAAGLSTKAALTNKPVGGVVFFAVNLQEPRQSADLLAALQKDAGTALFLAVDEEGGIVARLGRNSAMGTTAFPPMGEIGGADAARNVGVTIGNDLKRFGFNLDFAPVADVNSNPKNKVIGTRAFSSDPHIASPLVAACVEGFRESGTLCTLKHFPGHGDTATDSHYGTAVSEKSLEELRACEFLPFQAGIDAGAGVVMTGHISLPSVTGNDIPASLSREITTTLLREELGFQGLIVTDSLQMKAITQRWSAGEAAVMALQAGADVILMPENLDGAVSGILDALNNGTLTMERLEESVLRILQAKEAAGIL